jgi:hypothetical protein
LPREGMLRMLFPVFWLGPKIILPLHPVPVLENNLQGARPVHSMLLRRV